MPCSTSMEEGTCACVCACMYVCVHMCVRAHVCVCVCKAGRLVLGHSPSEVEGVASREHEGACSYSCWNMSPRVLLLV